MSRRHAAEKREVLPDAKYGSLVVTKFMNTMMYAGKKSVAEGIVYGAFEQMQKKIGGDPVKLFTDALDNRRTRCRSKSAPSARRHWPSAGSFSTPAAAPSRR